MGINFRELFGSIKGNCSNLSAVATFGSSAASPRTAVIRATPQRPPFDPPRSSQIQSLLSLVGADSSIARAVAESLRDRLYFTRNPSVALKCLLVVHQFLFSDDQSKQLLRSAIESEFNPPSTRQQRREVLDHVYSRLPHGSSPTSRLLSPWARWYAAVLKRFVLLDDNLKLDDEDSDGNLSSKTIPDLLREVELLSWVLDSIARSPPTDDKLDSAMNTTVVKEILVMVDKIRVRSEKTIVLRVNAILNHLDSVRYADMVELVFQLRRLEECSKKREGFWDEVVAAKEKAEKALELLQMEERGMGRRFRERLGESARFEETSELGSSEPVRFASARLVRLAGGG